MTREDYVRLLIRQRRQSIKEFASSIGIPYTTLLGMLKNGLGGAAIDNVVRVCEGLEISVDELQRASELTLEKEPFGLTHQERQLIIHYRERAQLQPAVNLLLGVDDE